jgi:hypothetical protein
LGKLVGLMVLKVSGPIDYSKINPSQYKDLFEDPASYEEAWGYECDFQWRKWQEAIIKKFSKMKSNIVWKRIM